LLRLEIEASHLNIQTSCSPSISKGGVGVGSNIGGLSRYVNSTFYKKKPLLDNENHELFDAFSNLKVPFTKSTL
jgi:hypothetical protein